MSKKQAQKLQEIGRKNVPQDSMLAHISPREASLLSMFGGSGRKDPQTGLPHFDIGGGDGGEGDGGGWGGYGYGGVGSSPGSGAGAGFGDGGDTGGGDMWGGWSPSAPGKENPTAADWGTDGEVNPLYSNEGLHYGDPAFAAQNSPVNSSPEVNWSDTWWGKTLRGMLAAQLGPVGVLGNMAYSLASSKNPGATAVGQLGSTAGSTIGSALGPAGAVAGAALGSNFGKGFSGGDASAVGNSKGTGGLGELGAGLYGLYRGSQAGGEANQLGNLYGQNSPYAQYLRTSLERRDAASGRRSQYGPREVELQARLADMYSRNYPMLQQAQARRDQIYGQGLGLLFRGADKMGYLDKAKDWITNQFTPDYSWAQPQSSATLGALYGPENYGSLTGADMASWGTGSGAFPGGDVF